MSWSETYTGSAEKVIADAKADHPRIVEKLPEWESGDVMRVIEAAEHALKRFNPRAEVALTVSGYGFRNQSNGTGGGELRVTAIYTIENPA